MRSDKHPLIANHIEKVDTCSLVTCATTLMGRLSWARPELWYQTFRCRFHKYIRGSNLLITVPADVLRPVGARPSADTRLTKMWTCFLSSFSVLQWPRSTFKGIITSSNMTDEIIRNLVALRLFEFRCNIIVVVQYRHILHVNLPPPPPPTHTHTLPFRAYSSSEIAIFDLSSYSTLETSFLVFHLSNGGHQITVT